MSDFIDMHALAEKLGMSYEWVRAQVKARRLPMHKFGTSVRFSEEDVAEIVTAHAVPVSRTPLRLASHPAPTPKPQPPPRPPRTDPPPAGPRNPSKSQGVAA